MTFLEFYPTLSCCIEALCKKEYESTLNLLLKHEGLDEVLGEKLELLRLFLETADFGHLRSQYEGYLMEGKKVVFILYPEGGKVAYKMVVKEN